MEPETTNTQAGEPSGARPARLNIEHQPQNPTVIPEFSNNHPPKQNNISVAMAHQNVFLGTFLDIFVCEKAFQLVAQYYMPLCLRSVPRRFQSQRSILKSGMGSGQNFGW
jgi:hypothetical protein